METTPGQCRACATDTASLNPDATDAAGEPCHIDDRAAAVGEQARSSRAADKESTGGGPAGAAENLAGIRKIDAAVQVRSGPAGAADDSADGATRAVDAGAAAAADQRPLIIDSIAPRRVDRVAAVTTEFSNTISAVAAGNAAAWIVVKSGPRRQIDAMAAVATVAGVGVTGAAGIAAIAASDSA